MQESLMQQGIDLMIYGMGTVFVFLTLLVILTFLMSAIVRRFFPEQDTVLVSTAESATTSVDPRIAKVIKAAIEQHRRSK